MSEAVRLRGPFDQDGNQPGGGDVVRLYSAERSSIDTSTQTNLQDVPGFDSDSAIISAIQGSRDVYVPGRYNYLREFDGSNDPKKLLKSWMFSLESLVLPRQGSGYQFEDDSRSTSFDPRASSSAAGLVVTRSSWTYESDEFYSFEYDLEGEITRSQQPLSFETVDYFGRDGYVEQEFSRSYSGVADQISAEGESYVFDEITRRSVDRSINIDVTEILADSGVNVGIINSGVTESVTASGRFVGDSARLGNVANFFDELQRGEEITFSDGVSERDFVGVLSRASTEFNQSEPSLLEVDFELEVGRSVA